MGNDIVICDLDGTIAEIPVEAYSISPIDSGKCEGCIDLMIEKEFISSEFIPLAFSALFKNLFNKKREIARKHFCHRPSFCENKPADKIKKIFSAENVLNFKPIIKVREIIWQLCRTNFNILYLSGRPVELLFSTSRWLIEKNFPIGLVACVGNDKEDPIVSKMKLAEIVISQNNPEIIVAFEDDLRAMKLYSEKFNAVNGFEMMDNFGEKWLDIKKSKSKTSD